MSPDVLTCPPKGCGETDPEAVPAGTELEALRGPQASPTGDPTKDWKWTYVLAPLALPAALVALSALTPALPRPTTFVPGIHVFDPADRVVAVLEGGGLPLAARLAAWRRHGLEFTSPNELLRVPGIGALLVDRWHPFLAPPRPSPPGERTTE